MQPADSKPDEQSGGFQPQKDYLTGTQENRSQSEAIPEQQQPQQPAPQTCHSPFQVSPPLHGQSVPAGPSQPSPPHTHPPSVPPKQKAHQKVPRQPETPQHSGECASWSPNQRLSENDHLFDASQGTVSPHPHHSGELIDFVFPETNKYKAEMAKMPSTSSLDRSDIVDFVVDDRSPEETKAIYNSWACNYEEDMSMQKYRAPNIMAYFINQELKIKRDAIILDVGCGTGLLGVQLKNLGYSLIDALDYSEEMMSEAKKKCVYKRHFLEKVARNSKIPLRDGEYDVVVLCGSLMPGHIMPDALHELGRLVRSSGYLMWIHRTLDHYEHKSEQFLETRFTATLHALCKQLRMELVVRKKIQDYRFKSDGQIFALKKK